MSTTGHGTPSSARAARPLVGMWARLPLNNWGLPQVPYLQVGASNPGTLKTPQVLPKRPYFVRPLERFPTNKFPVAIKASKENPPILGVFSASETHAFVAYPILERAPTPGSRLLGPGLGRSRELEDAPGNSLICESSSGSSFGYMVCAF